jgi:hypothetical protein
MQHYQDHSNSNAAGTVHLPAMLAAAFAALVGAVAWGMIAWLTGFEVGYVAWGIGLLVGFAAVKLGGRGVATASTAAALTLVAIFIGKVLGTHFLVEKEFTQVREEYFTAALFEELERDADAWSGMPSSASEDQVRQFMVDHDYGGFSNAGEIPPQDLAYFQSFSVPVLREFIVSEPGFQEWQDGSFNQYRAEFEAEYSLASLVVDELNAIDLIFAILAVSTAYGMISRASDSEHDTDAGDQQPPFQHEHHEVRRAA